MWVDRLYKTEYCMAHIKIGTEDLSLQWLKYMDLAIQSREYSSNCAVSDVGYNVLLDMLWYVQWDRGKNYEKKNHWSKEWNKIKSRKAKHEEIEPLVYAMCIKRFRRRLRKNTIVKLYHVTVKNMKIRKSYRKAGRDTEAKLKGSEEITTDTAFQTLKESQKDGSRIKRILKENKYVAPTRLLNRYPPKCEVDHCI